MRPVVIQSVTAIVPGFEEGEEFGELVDTDRLVSSMFGDNAGVPAGFVRERLGIESVAISDDTLRFCEEAWRGQGAGPHLEQMARGQSNHSLYRMLAQAVHDAFDKAKIPSQERDVAAHIHIVTYPQSDVEYQLREVRTATGLVGASELPTLIIQQGCAGLLAALRYADIVLAGSRAGARVLITAENNMLTHAAQRAHISGRDTNIDSWLWPAIFGEGVGAMVVGAPGAAGWMVSGISDEIVEHDWRVAPSWDAISGIEKVIVKASAVKQTYLRSVARLSREILAECGGIDRLSHLCLHESNPRIVRRVADGLGVPQSKVPSISAQVGTLAGVSAFTLLARVARSTAEESTQQVGMALIGEACGVVRAGKLVLHPSQPSATRGLRRSVDRAAAPATVHLSL